MPSPSTTDKCCLCQEIFDESNFPRLMPSCDHSVCTNCLKATFKNGTKEVVCQYCGNQQQISEADLQYFPKNITLIKQLKDSSTKKPSSTSQFSTPTKATQNGGSFPSSTSISSKKKLQPMNTSDLLSGDSSLISQQSSNNNYPHHQNSSHNLRKMCPTHNKEMEIICLTDFIKLCPLCAVFGTHKDHELKTIDQTAQMLSQTLKQFQQVKQKKKTIDTRIKNSQFKGLILQKICTARILLAKEIKQKFTAIKQAVANAEKNANEDLNKRFKQVNDRINKMVKQESEFEPFFTNWARAIELQLAQSNRMNIAFEEKAQIYINGPIKAMKEGQFYLGQLEAYSEEKRQRVETIPSQVTVELSDSLIKDIYNYVTVKFDDAFGGVNCKEVLLTSSRADNNNVNLNGMNTQNMMKQSRSNVFIQQNYGTVTSYPKSGKQSSSNKVSSTNSIQSSQANTNMMPKKPIKVQFSSSQNFLSPNNKNRLQSPSSGTTTHYPPKRSPRQKSKSLPKQQAPSSTNLIKSRISPQSKQIPHPPPSTITQERKRYLESSTQGIVELFITDDKLDTLDLCSFDMPDHQIVLLVDYVHNKKKIKCLKLSQNRLTNEGFGQILAHLRFATNLNLSSNLLTEDVLNTLIKQRQKVPSLRILNLAHNKVNQRKAKVLVDELKKQGIIVTL